MLPIPKDLQRDLEINNRNDAMLNFRTYLLRKNVNYRPVLVDQEILDCPQNTTNKGSIFEICMALMAREFLYKSKLRQ